MTRTGQPRTQTVEFVRRVVPAWAQPGRSWLPSLFTLANMLCGSPRSSCRSGGSTRWPACSSARRSSSTSPTAPSPGWSARSPRSACSSTPSPTSSLRLAPSLLTFALFSAGRDGFDPWAGLDRLLRVGGLRGHPARPVQRHHRPHRRQALLRRPALPGAAGVVMASVLPSPTSSRAATGCGCSWSRGRPGAAHGLQHPVAVVSGHWSAPRAAALRPGHPTAVLVAIGLATVPVLTFLRGWPTATCSRRCWCPCSRRWVAWCPAGSGSCCRERAPRRPDDVDVVLGLVRELADYEKSLDEARMTRDQLHDALFGDSPACSATSPATTGRGGRVRAVVPELLHLAGAPTGCTWRTSTSPPTTGAPAWAASCCARWPRSASSATTPASSGRCWTGTTPSIEFYRAAGARPQDGWSVFRLTGTALTEFAQRRTS